MKKLTVYLLLPMLFLFACEVEKLNDQDNLNSTEAKGKKNGNANSFIEYEPSISKECIVIDADRCPFNVGGGNALGEQPSSNFWWPDLLSTDGVDISAFFNPEDYFGSLDGNSLSFTEYDDGTARIQGTTKSNGFACTVEVDVWLINKTSWSDWQAGGGDHKKEGCAGDASNSEDMYFYVIDSERSTITAAGADCYGEGTFGLEQRPDPSDGGTPNFGAHIGPGGANYDSDLGAIGLSTWGWITDKDTGERLWIMDFNLTFDCEVEEPECETAFARGDNGDTCFGDTAYDFSRWGWTIGPLSEGEYSYEIYAAAGQCDITKGELVGTVDVSYSGGDVSVTYNIDSDYEVEETHTYAGNEMFPIKNGNPTVAPGQYSIGENLSGEIYVIAHAVVCK